MMFKPKRLTFDELVERLRVFEHKYGYSTIEFYRRFENGELGDDDDLMMWAGIYYLHRKNEDESQDLPLLKLDDSPAARGADCRPLRA